MGMGYRKEKQYPFSLLSFLQALLKGITTVHQCCVSQTMTQSEAWQIGPARPLAVFAWIVLVCTSEITIMISLGRRVLINIYQKDQIRSRFLISLSVLNMRCDKLVCSSVHNMLHIYSIMYPMHGIIYLPSIDTGIRDWQNNVSCYDVGLWKI